MSFFYFSYQGNKRGELKNIIPLIDLNKYDIIIEPFAGSASISRALYALDNTKKYIISDNDTCLVNFCNEFYKDDDAIIKKALKQIKKIDCKETFDKYINTLKNNNNISHDEYLIYNTYYAIRKGLYPLDRKPSYIQLKKNKDTINEFFKNNKYRCCDYTKYMNKYKDDTRAFIFLDPPYINSTKSNGFYESPSIDWEWLREYFKTCNCKFIMIVEDNIFMRILYKKWFKGSYNKLYQNTKRKTMHVIYSNIHNINI